jgi:hypothetical protein
MAKPLAFTESAGIRNRVTWGWSGTMSSRLTEWISIFSARMAYCVAKETLARRPGSDTRRNTPAAMPQPAARRSAVTSTPARTKPV